MLTIALRELRPAAALLAALTLITGLAYPLAVTGIGHSLFPRQSSGSLVQGNGKPVGSELIAQQFTTPGYFWPRPSACDYNAASSSGSNLAMSNSALLVAVKERIAMLRASDPQNTAPIPVDLVLASASGLDPHISVEAARWQTGRVARERGLDRAKLEALVGEVQEAPTFGLLGEPRVNVLRLNQALDSLR
jgi:K+-transporting ATPase ATPase C chain